MSGKIKVLMIGAHPDDNDFCGGGTALRYIQAGHTVRFVSVSDGRCGHHRLSPAETARRRLAETKAVEKLTGIIYDVWDIPDGEVMPDLETRKRLIRYIRAFSPDIIFTHRTNDYHPDHRNTSLLTRDASYLLTVPSVCPDTPAMRKMPLIAFFADRFAHPPFRPDVLVSIDAVIDELYKIYNCHVSQIYEWLPYTHGEEESVPQDEKDRLEWYRSPRVPRERTMSVEEIFCYPVKRHNECRQALPAAKYREKLIARYGEAGKDVIFAEAFEISEYGAQPSEEESK